MLAVSWVVIFLMAIRVIPASFALSFVAYGASVAGLFLGLKGIMEYIRIQRSSEKEKDDKKKEGKFEDWYK